MWVFLNDAMFSIVSDRGDSNRLLVRARRREDLERHFKGSSPIELPEADYRWRIFVPRQEMAEKVARWVESIAYGNFKGSVKAPDRLAAYTEVWHVMDKFQRDSE